MADVYYLRPATYGKDTCTQEPQDRQHLSPLKVHKAPPSPHHNAKRKAASEQLKGKLRTVEKSGVRSPAQGQRHVTFAPSPLKREPHEVHPAFRRRERRHSSRVEDVTPVDHQIAVNGGTTSTLECLPHRLRISKNQHTPSPQQRVEELTKQAGYLNQELAYYKDTRKVLMKLFDSMQATHRTIQASLTEAHDELRISEQRYIGYWVPQYDERNQEENIF